MRSDFDKITLKKKQLPDGEKEIDYRIKKAIKHNIN